MSARLIAQSLAGLAVLVLLLFAPAGTLSWPQAWLFLMIYVVCSAATGLWLWAIDPALLAERMKSPLAAGQRTLDRVVMGAIVVAFVGWFVLIGLDARRFAWSQVPAWVEGIGAVLLLGAFLGWAVVLRANSFAASTVRLQPERGQTVISDGPYGLVRHPMYAFALLFLIGTSLLLGSLWSLTGLLVFTPLLAVRALNEEEMLVAGLPGYRDYAAKVHFRLLPGVW